MDLDTPTKKKLTMGSIVDYNKMLGLGLFEEQNKMLQSLLSSITSQMVLETTMPVKQLMEQIMVAPLLTRPFDELIKAFIAHEERVDALRKDPNYNKFPFLMCGQASVSLVNKAIEMWEGKEEKEVFELFYQLTCDEGFQNELCEELLKNTLFEARMPIIKDALEAHQNGKFSLSIPTLYPVIDGVIIEAFSEDIKVKGKPNAGKISPKLKDKFKEDTSELGAVISFMQATYTPKRSKILHGLLPSYYKERELSTLLVMALGSTKYIIETYKEMKNEMEKTDRT